MECGAFSPLYPASPEQRLRYILDDAHESVLLTNSDQLVGASCPVYLIRSHRDAYRVTRRDHVSCVAGLGFDAVVLETSPYLAVGASVSLADETVRASSEALPGWLVDAKISMAFCFAAPLVRIEAQIALPTLLRHLPGLALVRGTLAWRQKLDLRGLARRPVTFNAS